MGQLQGGASAFGVVHKAVGDQDDPKFKAPAKVSVKRAGPFDAGAIRAKLAPLKAEALKSVTKR